METDTWLAPPLGGGTAGLNQGVGTPPWRLDVRLLVITVLATSFCCTLQDHLDKHDDSFLNPTVSGIHESERAPSLRPNAGLDICRAPKGRRSSTVQLRDLKRQLISLLDQREPVTEPCFFFVDRSIDSSMLAVLKTVLCWAHAGSIIRLISVSAELKWRISQSSV